MIVFPAIDLMNKKVVRLCQGKASNKKIYSDSPLEVAKNWKRQGSRWLHVVDLDAALGKGNNLDVIGHIARIKGINIQVGGGIRTVSYARKLLDKGIKRVIVSTQVFRSKAFLGRLLKAATPTGVVLSIDVKDGKVALEGWKKTLSLDVRSLCVDLQRQGLKWLIYTDVSRDGTLKGVNSLGIKKILQATSMKCIAAGGIASLADIKKLRSVGVSGVILGKALYERKFTLLEALEVAKNEK